MNKEARPAIVFFDGVCNFCNYWVNFSLKRNRKQTLLFAPLQGETALKLLPPSLLRSTESVILVEQDKIYSNSTAALRIARQLRFPWNLSYGLIIVPKFIRDGMYRLIARNRYRWFGKKPACPIPDASVKNRFLP